MPALPMVDVFDVIIVAYFIYRLMLILKGTRATAIIKGLAILFIANAIARYAGFRTVTWILTQGTTVVLVALPIVFYPELRRALEHLGRGQLFSRLTAFGQSDTKNVIDAVVRAARILSQARTGALIVFEREVGLEEYIESGVQIDGAISSELLLNIFTPLTPLHDGAVIIRGNRIVSAGSFLPLTDAALPPELGTRHRAAVGVTEVSDCVVVVVSEETGTITIAEGGALRRNLDENQLRAELTQALEHAGSLWRGWFK
ncbi:MAG TPA: TIGR00159 family protein [Firmicutes bacterium]|nr:TIGR00159 family protein [Bacillota bacterium]